MHGHSEWQILQNKKRMFQNCEQLFYPHFAVTLKDIFFRIDHQSAHHCCPWCMNQSNEIFLVYE